MNWSWGTINFDELNNPDTTDPEALAARQELQKEYRWSSLPDNPLPTFHRTEESCRASAGTILRNLHGI